MTNTYLDALEKKAAQVLKSGTKEDLCLIVTELLILLSEMRERQPCGHVKAEIVHTTEGTCYCMACDIESTRLLGLRQRVVRLEREQEMVAANVAFYGVSSPFTFCLLVNDVYGPGADAEVVPDELFGEVYQIFKIQGEDGLLAWVDNRRSKQGGAHD